jgi:hypothetical protein
MRTYLVVLSIVSLLPACQPADPAPAACNQPQADKAVYLLGQYIDPSFALGRDSVVCLNVGQDNSNGISGSASRLSGVFIYWATKASLPLEDGQIPGFRSDYTPNIEISFVFAPSGRPNTELPSDLTVGRYAWGSSQSPDSPFGGLAPRPGVEVVLRRSLQSAPNPDNWFSSGTEQSPSSFFEITRLEPHPTRPEQVVITGQFTAQVFGRADPLTRARPSILLRNVQFRAYIRRPEEVYRRF